MRKSKSMETGTFRLVRAGAAAVALAWSSSVAAAETDLLARVHVAEQCYAAKAEFAELARPGGTQEAGFLAPLLASFVGSLAQGGVSGVANAIDRAASEHTFKASGTRGFAHGQIRRSSEDLLTPFSYQDGARCMLLAVPDPDSPGRRGVVPINATSELVGIDKVAPSASRAELIEVMRGPLRLETLPLVYAEVAILPDRQGVQIVPLKVWYRKALPGASRSRAQRTELHVALASPGYSTAGDPLGSFYAFSRFRLPRMRPGPSSVLSQDDLRDINPIFHASRPIAAVDTALVAELNGTFAAYQTAKATTMKAQADLRAAQADFEDKPTAANRVAVETRSAALSRAKEAETRAGTLRANQPGDGNTRLLGRGRANVRMTFLTIRDENRFAKAIATALGAQAEAVGTAVAGRLTPSPAWNADDTAMITAQATLNSAIAALGAATTEGDPVKIVAAEGAVLVAKAKLNEAAIAIGKAPPFTDLSL